VENKMAVVEEDDNGTKEKLREDLDSEQKAMHENMQSSLEEVWQKIFDLAFILCPVDTGTLQSTIALVLNEPAKGWTSYSYGGGNKAITIYDATIVAGDDSITRPDGYPCIYAQWVHDGHYTPWGTWVEEQPFLEMAIMAYEGELQQAIERVMRELEEGRE
jgi:hypothetical protein